MSKLSNVAGAMLAAGLISSCAAGNPEDERLVVGGTAELLTLSGAPAPGVKLTLVASVGAPKVGSTIVQANGFWLGSNVAYVSYNNAGALLVGAIDIIDLTQPATPHLLADKPFPTTKINAITVSNGSLYYAGADQRDGAVVGSIALNGNALTDTTLKATLSSFAGTGIAAAGGVLYVTSGDTGGITLFQADLVHGVHVPVQDARGVAVTPDGKTIGVVTGQPGGVSLFAPNGDFIASYGLGGATIPESKSTIQFGARSALASLGDGGFALVCTQNGRVLASAPAITVSNIASTGTVTNAAYGSRGLVFTADGMAGVHAYQLALGPVVDGTNCTKDTLTLIGYIDFGAAYSANMVYASNDYLFVADGTGGFRIVHIDTQPFSGEDDDFVAPSTGLVVLNASSSGALALTGNATLQVKGNIYVDSTSSSALTANGNAMLSGDAVFLAGGRKLTGNATISGAIVSSAQPMPDPLAWLPVPSTSGMSVRATKSIAASATLDPGVYHGIQLSGNAQVTLNPGVYYIADGGLSLSGNASLSGAGVFIYNASTTDSISLSGTGTIRLTPMTQGTYAGITLFQNRMSTRGVSLSGNGVMDIHGTLYAPAAALTLSGNSQLPTLGSLDVADTISITGNGGAVVAQ